MIQLIVCDIDGTLCDDKGHILPSTIQTIKKCQKQGIRVCIASGRDFMEIKPILQQLKEIHIEYVIALNGGLIKDLALKKEYKCEAIPKTLIQQLLEFMDNPQIRFWLVEGKATYCYAKGYYYLLETYHSIIRKISLALNPHQNLREFHMITNVKQVKHDYRKVVYEGRPEILEEMYEGLQDKFGHVLEIFFSQKDAIDMMPKGINKGYGVKQLMKLMNLKEDEVMCFGDSENDVSMFEVVKYSVAMGNAKDKVKEKAFYITTSNNNDGIQKAIHKFISFE